MIASSRRIPTLRLITAALLLSPGLQGCATWVRQRGPVQDVLSVRSERVIRVRTPDTVTVLHQPTVTRDSLHGIVRFPARTPSSQLSRFVTEPASLALDSIVSVDVRRISKKRTALLVAGVSAAALGAMVVVIGAGMDFDDFGSSCGGFMGCSP